MEDQKRLVQFLSFIELSKIPSAAERHSEGKTTQNHS